MNILILQDFLQFNFNISKAMKKRKLTESVCISDIQNYHGNIIVKKVIWKLKRFKEFLLSGDSGLNNFWEEYCVQLQDEQSFYFESYVDTIRNYIDDEISKQPIEIQNLLDFSENIDYDESDEFNKDEYCYFRMDAIDKILVDIDSIAINYNGKNLKKYFNI